MIQHNLLTINAKNYTDEVIQNLIQLYSAANLIQQSITKTMLVATKDDKVVGIGCVANDLISTVFVDIHHHKFGIGKSILHTLELIAKNNGIKNTILYASINATHFYERQGYELVSNSDSEKFGKSAFMKKNLFQHV